MTEKRTYFKPIDQLYPAHRGRRVKSCAKFRAVMEGKRLSSMEISSKLGLTPTGCTTMLYRMEKRGVVKRVGTKPRPKNARLFGRPQVIWEWIGGPEAGE